MIFPIPKEEKYLTGIYDLNNDNINLTSLVDFNNSLDNCPDIFFNVNSEYGSEEYTIIIDESGINLTFYGNEGRFRAASSLYQLIKKQT